MFQQMPVTLHQEGPSQILAAGYSPAPSPAPSPQLDALPQPSTCPKEHMGLRHIHPLP